MGQRELELQEPNPEIGNEAFPCPPVDNYWLGASLEQALFLSLGPILWTSVPPVSASAARIRPPRGYPAHAELGA
jgi:hypothetical protein